MGMGTRFEPLDVEGLEEVARAQYARAFPAREGPSPRPRNAGAALHMLGAERMAFVFRGVAYELLPISFEDGIRVSEARAALMEAEDEDRLTPEVARDARRALKLVANLAPKYLRPLRWPRRLLWALGLKRNPYRRATEVEVGQLMGFFLGSRTMCRVRSPAG